MQWKFAFLSLGRPEYLQDGDVVASRFQVGGVMGTTGSSVLHLQLQCFKYIYKVFFSWGIMFSLLVHF